MNINNRRSFEEFESDDFKRYQNRLLLWFLEGILTVKGKLTSQDLKNAEDNCRVLIQQNLEVISKNWCFLRESGDDSLNTSKCCLAQLRDARDLQREAVELAHSMKSYLVLRLYDQPDDKRLQIIDNLQNIFTTISEEELTSGDISTFPGFFQFLVGEMHEIDELMSGQDFKMKPALEFLLRELGPRIVLKFKKYSENSTLGYDECEFCNNCWVQEPDIKNLQYSHCFKTPAKLESFLALRFR